MAVPLCRLGHRHRNRFDLAQNGDDGIDFALGEEILGPATGPRGERRFVVAGDVDGAILGKDVNEQVEEVQLVGVERLAGKETSKGVIGSFAVEAGQRAQEQPQAAMFVCEEVDLDLAAESGFGEDDFQGAGSVSVICLLRRSFCTTS